MEAGEELRLSRAGFRPVRRRYVVTALLAAVAAMTAELWTIQLHATWPEACFKPWRSSLTILLHAFLTALRLVCSSTRKLCSYYGTYRVCVGFVSLLLVGYFLKTVWDVTTSYMLNEGVGYLANYALVPKYIVYQENDQDHFLHANQPRTWESIVDENSLPVTQWRYVGESVEFTCEISFVGTLNNTVWMQNGNVISRDDPSYKHNISLQGIRQLGNGKKMYHIKSYMTIDFITKKHFGVYDCMSAYFQTFVDHDSHDCTKGPSKGLACSSTRRELDWKLGSLDHHCHASTGTDGGRFKAQEKYKRIGTVHLREIKPEKRVMVIPVGGVLIYSENHVLLASDEPDYFSSLEYKVNGQEIVSLIKNYRFYPLVCSPFIYAYFWCMKITQCGFPSICFRRFNRTYSYSLHQRIPFPTIAFGEYKLIFYRHVTNHTTGAKEIREVDFPVTFFFKPSPPLLMELYFYAMDKDNNPVEPDLSNPFVSGLMDLCLLSEGLVLLLILVAVTWLVIMMSKLTFQKVLVPLWHVIFLLGFQPPPEETLADICVTQPQEPELRYDVFVSYASEDPEDRYFVLHVLLPKLQRLGLSVCLPERERAPNETELRGTSHLVQACSFYIVVVTPSYIECAICNRLELPFILSRFQYREVNDHQVVLVKLRACIIPGGLYCSLPVVDLTRDEGQGHLNDVIRDWNPQNRLRANQLIRHFE